MTLGLGPDDKRMKLRYAGSCRLCGRAHGAGAEAIYERARKAIRCVECDKPAVEAPPVEVVGGETGASARREYERRRDAREQRIRGEHPKLGGLILALSDDPQSTKAWERGAVGEELMAKRLADVPDTFRVMHDRRIRGTKANIDHIAIGPSGVWVIDAKRYKDKRPELRVGGGLFRPRVESLRVGGGDGTKLVDGVKSQVDRVSDALADDTIPITAVLSRSRLAAPRRIFHGRRRPRRLAATPHQAHDGSTCRRLRRRRHSCAPRTGLPRRVDRRYSTNSDIHAQRGAVSASAFEGGAGTVSICLGSEFGMSGSMRPGWA